MTQKDKGIGGKLSGKSVGNKIFKKGFQWGFEGTKSKMKFLT